MCDNIMEWKEYIKTCKCFKTCKINHNCEHCFNYNAQRSLTEEEKQSIASFFGKVYEEEL